MKTSMKKSCKSSGIFPESSDSEGEEVGAPTATSSSPSKHFTINANYAQRYDTWRNKEEVMKVKARYGVDNIEDIQVSSESESSSEDEWTPAKEKAFFKTLSSLKSKDPKIYDPGTQFFTQEEKDRAERDSQGQEGSVKPEGSQRSERIKKKSKDKPFLLKDHERTMILEKGGLMSSDEEDEEEGQTSSKRLTNPDNMAIAPLSYYQELDSIKKGFSKALKDIHSDEEDSDEDKLLKNRKPKSVEEEQEEEEAYRLWLKGELGRLTKGKLSKGEEKELGFLKSYWNDDKLDEGEKFLRDYILNRKYIEPEEEDTEYIPTYNEIVHDSDEGGLSNDEQFENEREEFEHKYNFRFEEPDPDFIKRFPRTIQDSLRRENEKRKKQRESAKDRKKEAKDRKLEEVQRLKAMKRKEIVDKLHQLQEISGDPDLPLEDMDIEGDFDPEEYDRRMQKVFSDKYYDVDAADDKKPEFPFDPDIDDEVNWEEWVPSEDDDDSSSKKKKSARSSKNVPEDEDTESTERSRQKAAKRKQKSIDELIESSKGKKSNKKKSAFMEILEKKKPKFDPKLHKSFDKYFREYYALDFEDLIGDLPCRFKYRKVTPNDFGLSTKEILKGEDRELNQWASLKKTYQYRADDEEKYEAQAYQKKAENEQLKKRSLPSIYDTKAVNASDDEQESDDENPAEVQNGRLAKMKSTSSPKSTEASEPENGTKMSKRKRKNKKRKNKAGISEAGGSEVSEEGVTKPTKKNSSPAPPSTLLKPEPMEGGEKKVKKKKKTRISSELPEEVPKKSKKTKGLKRVAEVVEVEDDRLKAYGLNPKKYKKWVKYGGGGATS